MIPIKNVDIHSKNTKIKIIKNMEQYKDRAKVLNTELGILPSNVYVSYSEFENFGWNGRNF